jgi:uncharacterized damage-inducible protein DinB
MLPILDDIGIVLRRELDGLQREVALFPDDHTLWATTGGITNSAGNLALHIAGNLQHFIGHELGGRPYRRDREREFGFRNGSRADVIEEVRRAQAIVGEVLPRLTADDLTATFDAHAGVAVPAQRFLLHLCTHTAFHVGQVGYLRRILTGDPRSTNAVTAGGLAGTS